MATRQTVAGVGFDNWVEGTFVPTPRPVGPESKRPWKPMKKAVCIWRHSEPGLIEDWQKGPRRQMAQAQAWDHQGEGELTKRGPPELARRDRLTWVRERLRRECLTAVVRDLV